MECEVGHEAADPPLHVGGGEIEVFADGRDREADLLLRVHLRRSASPPGHPENLNLTTDMGNTGIASISGSVFARLVMRTACDLASTALTLSTAPAVYFTSGTKSQMCFLLRRILAHHFSVNSVLNELHVFWTSRRLGQRNRNVAVHSPCTQLGELLS